MARRWLLPMTLLALVAACESPGAPTTTTTTTVPVAPPSTMVTSTSTTSSVLDTSPVDICARGMVWEVGTRYVADCFVRPMVFVPAEDGWVSSGAGDSHVLLRWSPPDSTDLAVRVAFVAYRTDRTPTEVLETIVSFDNDESVALAAPARDVEVNGWPGVWASLEGGPEQNAPVDPPCSAPSSPVWFSNVQFGHGFFPIAASRVVGVGACDLVEAWILDVGGMTLTILAGTGDPSDHGAVVGVVEGLFASMEFLP